MTEDQIKELIEAKVNALLEEKPNKVLELLKKEKTDTDKAGLVYVAKCPCFYGLVKVGETSKQDFKSRGLGNTSVPEDFEALALFDCEDRKAVEKSAHSAFKMWRHYRKDGGETEFFFADKADEIIEHISGLPGVKRRPDRTGMRAENSSFEKFGIPVGAKLYWQGKTDPQYTAIVLDKKNKIDYQGKQRTMSNVGISLHGNSINGWVEFYYNGKPIKEKPKAK